MDNGAWEFCQLRHEGVQEAFLILRVYPLKKKILLKKGSTAKLGTILYHGLFFSSSQALRNLEKKNHKIWNLLNRNEMY